MNETKSYKNLNKTDFDIRSRINFFANKAAFMVPRLLEKMAEKLIISPITKLVTGQSYEDVKKEAVDMAMGAQKAEVEGLNKKIEEGQANLEAWRADTEYLVGNMAEYKAYQSTIERLEKRRTRMITSPKKLMIGKAYLSVMKERREQRKGQKQVRKMVQQVVNDYMIKRSSIKDKELEIQALESALRTARGELTSMNQDLQQFSVDNAEIINQINLEEDYVEVATEEPVVPSEEVVVETPTMEVQTETDINVEQPVVDSVAEEVAAPEVPAQGFRAPEASDLGQVLPTSVDPALLVQMAQMAAMPQVPTSDAQTLESYGLAEEETQKHL